METSKDQTGEIELKHNTLLYLMHKQGCKRRILKCLPSRF